MQYRTKHRTHISSISTVRAQTWETTETDFNLSARKEHDSFDVHTWNLGHPWPSCLCTLRHPPSMLPAQMLSLRLSHASFPTLDSQKLVTFVSTSNLHASHNLVTPQGSSQQTVYRNRMKSYMSWAQNFRFFKGSSHVKGCRSQFEVSAYWRMYSSVEPLSPLCNKFTNLFCFLRCVQKRCRPRSTPSRAMPFSESVGRTPRCSVSNRHACYRLTLAPGSEPRLQEPWHPWQHLRRQPVPSLAARLPMLTLSTSQNAPTP